jgi:hypothetical protein
MTTSLAFVIAPLLGLLVAYGFARLVDLVRNDGYGRPTASHQPPRSHVPDEFEHLAHL